MDGCVSVGGVKIDDSVSYSAAACWAGVIDNEIHVNFLSLWANGGHSKGSAKIVMLRGRTPCDGISIELSSANFVPQLVDTFGADIHKLSTGYPQPQTP